jgi:EAL domain-containing protein (putative c-di-GMP-specific phosphodiesterase class I)/DNA-binding NarL/FixJ family response regulator
MSKEPADVNRRILVIDDNQAIHEDFSKILRRESSGVAELSAAAAAIFGDVVTEMPIDEFRIDSAFQGEQGHAMVREALAQHRPYAIAFIDVRMPPGWDGIETAARICQVDPNVQIVICTAYSDYSWKEMTAKLGRSDRFIILKKPFDNIEVLQLADALTRKWQRASDGCRRLATLQQLIRDRTNDLNGSKPLCAVDDGQLALAAQAVSTQDGRELILEDDLRRALEAGELSVHYQPLVEVGTRRVASLEALVRWQHPEKGWIPPNVFIPVAERSGLILALGEFVLRTACEQTVRWEREGLEVFPVAVNISAVQLQGQNIVQLVRDLLLKTRMSPHRLVLELTESALIQNVEQHVVSLQALRRDGIGIAIDDFGTGYSSLSYLKQLPVDVLKIDRSFIAQIDSNPVNAAIVNAIVAMAHSLQLRVVAEGVETTGQLRVLAANGCDLAQGFLFSRPLPAVDCARFLSEWGHRRTSAGGVQRATNVFAVTPGTAASA